MIVYMIKLYVGDKGEIMEHGAFFHRQNAQLALDNLMEYLSKNDKIMDSGHPINCEIIEVPVVDIPNVTE